MKEPTILVYIILVSVSLLLALAGLYLLVNFNRLFKGSIKNEILRKNVAAWLIIFCISSASHDGCLLSGIQMDDR